MTYGWAIMIFLVVIRALAYFGVLNPSKILPRVCIINSKFNCDDVSATVDGDVALIIRNGLSSTLKNITLTIEGIPASCAFSGNNWLANELMICSASSFLSGSIGDLFSASFTLSYFIVNGDILHTEEGFIRTKLEESFSILGSSDSTICQNAESAGLCDGLDLVYGEGYQASCCSLSGLCC